MACTTLLVGRRATNDGSTIVARNEDGEDFSFDPKKMIVVMPEDQPRTYTGVASHLTIELPDNPLRYTCTPNADPTNGVWAETGINAANVSMSATETISANARVLGADPLVTYQPAVGKPGDANYKPEVPGGIGEENLPTITLPYIKSAREGVRRLGMLVEKYGTYETNGVAFGDADEVWYWENIGGHHWIARRVPDDCYATIPNQLGIDDFDLADAFGEQREYLCSADLREFMATHHLDRTMGTPVSSNGRHAHSAGFGTTVALPTRFNPRKAFGTATPKDHIYNTPRAWYMQRRLNPSEDWDSPAARYTPESDDIPWCRVPEDKVSLEDVDFLLSSHFEGTPYDPYGTTGTAESRHRYRPIGVNRTGHMVAIQVRPYVPAANRTVMWVSFGSGPFTAAAPFYANVNDTPAYLRDTTPEVSTGNLYWTNRLIAVVADAHWYETNRFIEGYAEGVRAFGHRLIERTDEQLLARSDAESTDTNAWPLDGGHGDEKDVQGVADVLEAANDEMADYLREHTTKLLNDVLYTSSNLMHNSFAMSDRWAE